jgi:fimbrial chaperone protein
MVQKMRLKLAFAAFMSLGCMLPEWVGATTLVVTPTLINLAPGQTSATVEIQNHGLAPVALQARVFAWSQTGDNDMLVPTSDIIISPPIFTTPVGASQTVRLLLRGAARASQGSSYRLLLDEVPVASAKRGQVVVALRMSLPVMITSSQTGPALLTWHAERTPDGNIILTAVNAGLTYAIVSGMEVTMADGSHPMALPLGKNPYVLAGSRRQWIVRSSSAASRIPLRLSFDTQAGRTDQALIP